MRTSSIIAILLGVILMLLCHMYGTHVRGYEAIGGEFVMLFMPYLVLYMVRWWRDEQ